jgi:hypothetical protein
MVTLFQFSRNIRKHGSKIENNSVELTKRVAKKTLRSVVYGTPVDTGVARSNWRVSIGNPTFAVIPAYYPSEDLGRGEKLNAMATISAGIKKIDKLRVGKKRGTGQAGSALFISNATPYLSQLRTGTSKQQPRDWVNLALIDASIDIKQARLLVRGENG